MARDYYWVESRPRPRAANVTTAGPPPPGLHRAHTYDAAAAAATTSTTTRGSTRSARVDFADVTRKEASALRRANDALERENAALKANFRASVDHELRKCVPALEKAVRGLEYENAQLRAGAGAGGGYGAREREREEAMRKLRHQNTKLRNDNDALRERVGRLEQEGPGASVHRRLVEEVRKWKAQCASMDDEAERLYHKTESVVRRNKRLEMANESAARQARELQRDVEYYKAILRRHGFATR